MTRQYTSAAAEPKPLFCPWALSAADVAKHIDANLECGLSPDEAQRRILNNKTSITRSWTNDLLIVVQIGQKYFLDSKTNCLFLIIGLALLPFGRLIESALILALISLKFIFFYWQSRQQHAASVVLKKSIPSYKLVIRNSDRIEIPAEQIVVGDLVYLPRGELAVVDGRVVEAVTPERFAKRGETDFSLLEVTSLPLSDKTTANKRTNMVYNGDFLQSGSIVFLVTAVGESTISFQEVINQKQHDSLIKRLSRQVENSLFIIAVLLLVFIPLSTFNSSSQSWKTILPYAAVVVFACVPSGIFTAFSLALIQASHWMALKGVLVQNPRASEMSGQMSVLLSDKTGTLTEETMEVTRLYLNGKICDISQSISPDRMLDQIRTSLTKAIRIVKYCNNGWGATEQCLFTWANNYSFWEEEEVNSERMYEFEFDYNLRRMTTVHSGKNTNYQYVLTKGSPEYVLELCTSAYIDGRSQLLDEALKSQINNTVKAFTTAGLRIVALANRKTDQAMSISNRKHAERDLEFLGLLGLSNPPRKDVRSAIDSLIQMGVQPVIVTGDNLITTFEIAKRTGIVQENELLEDIAMTGEQLRELDGRLTPVDVAKQLSKIRIFSRVTPEDKARIIQLLSQIGYIVGMIGDGPNDMVALQNSWVGFAAGGGKDAAQKVADAILINGSFSSVIDAVKASRKALTGYLNYLSFVFSSGLTILFSLILTTVFHLPLPFTIMGLLIAGIFYNLSSLWFFNFSDSVSTRKSVNQPTFNRQRWIYVAGFAIIGSIILLIEFSLSLEWSNNIEQSQIIILFTFLLLSFGQLIGYRKLQ